MAAVKEMIWLLGDTHGQQTRHVLRAHEWRDYFELNNASPYRVVSVPFRGIADHYGGLIDAGGTTSVG